MYLKTVKGIKVGDKLEICKDAPIHYIVTKVNRKENTVDVHINGNKAEHWCDQGIDCFTTHIPAVPAQKTATCTELKKLLDIISEKDEEIESLREKLAAIQKIIQENS